LCRLIAMDIVNNIAKLQGLLKPHRQEGSIGFVPTMGALHEGHLSLVREAVKNNSVTVVSIYVNPTQFNDKSDLDRYPRDLQRDIKLLKKTGCDVIFSPSDREMYPEPDNRKFDFGALETVMEGKYRPGHFNGVGQIVSKLFDAVIPHKAYFGLKDFQQLAIIKKLVSDLNYPVEIVPCAIVRESDGLAMSSRNELLSPEMRKAAPFVYQTLKDVSGKSKSHPISSIKANVKQAFKNHELLELEYFEIVNDFTLQSIDEMHPKTACTACIAVFAGKIRLIDNVQLNS
jgi:pantoate--beta-alanine ligase